MYNFRYHLVTICSIFIALALGLLLGAAIASSELVRATSDDMIDSMLSRYETLISDNTRLEEELEDNSALATELTASWATDRLDGRTIVLLLGNTLEDRNLQNSLTDTLKLAGASVVNVTVLENDFGLEDENVRTALQGIVEEVSGEEYPQTLAKALQKEWSYVYITSSATPTEEDLNTPRHIYALPVEDAAIASETAITSIPTDGGLAPQTAFQQVIFDEYPLTRALLTLGVISIGVDYAPLLEHADPAPPDDQQAALRIATSWQLPYGTNGLVNGLAQQQDEAMIQTRVGLQLTLSMQEAGIDYSLPYPAWLRASLPKVTSGEVPMPNYFTLLIQPSYLNSSMDILASENNLSCVTSPDTIAGRFSILALLSGAQSGIYGEGRDPEFRFAPMPEDPSGRAIFR